MSNSPEVLLQDEMETLIDNVIRLDKKIAELERTRREAHAARVNHWERAVAVKIALNVLAGRGGDEARAREDLSKMREDRAK